MEMVRTKRAYGTYPEDYHPRGGFMPFPPFDCPQIKLSSVDEVSGIRWIDNVFCAVCKSPCHRLMEYMAHNYAEYRSEMRRLDLLHGTGTY